VIDGEYQEVMVELRAEYQNLLYLQTKNTLLSLEMIIITRYQIELDKISNKCLYCCFFKVLTVFFQANDLGVKLEKPVSLLRRIT